MTNKILKMTEGSYSNLGDRSIEILQTELYREKKKNEQTPRNIWDKIKCTNIPAMKILGDKERKRKNTTEKLQNFLETLVSTLRNQQKSR